MDELSAKMKEEAALSSASHDLLLAPVTGRAHYQRNCSQKPLRSLNSPRIACDFQLDRVNVEVRDVQYRQMVDCCRSIELLSRGLPFRRWRRRLEEEAGGGANRGRRWWTFAAHCVISDIKKKNSGRNWNFVSRRVADILRYVRSYREYLTHPAGMMIESKLERERIELELELEELEILRSLAMEQIVQSEMKSSDPCDEEATSQSTFQRWFSSWWTADVSSLASQDRSTNEERQMENEILETLEDALRDTTVRQRDFLPLQLTCTLKQGLKEPSKLIEFQLHS